MLEPPCKYLILRKLLKKNQQQMKSAERAGKGKGSNHWTESCTPDGEKLFLALLNKSFYDEQNTSCS